jgi:hypothetical protein
MCECMHNPQRLSLAESSSLLECIGTLNKFLTLIKYVKNKVLKSKERLYNAEAATSPVDLQAYGNYVEYLESKVTDAMKTLINIRHQKQTKLFPIYALQSLLSNHLDTSADRANHFITRAEEALDQPLMANYARQAETQLTVFYDSYREHAVDTDKAFVIHRSVPNSASSAPDSDPPRDGYSFLTYGSCVYCSHATSLHKPIDQKGDIATVALSFAREVVQEPDSSLWIEVSKAGSNTPDYDRPETGGSETESADSKDYAKKGLSAAAKITLDDPEEDDVEDGVHGGYGGATSYFYTLPDGSARMEILPEKLVSVLNKDIGNKASFSDVATTFAASLLQTAQTLRDAFQSLRQSKEISDFERFAGDAIEKELESVRDVLTKVDPTHSSAVSDLAEQDSG